MNELKSLLCNYDNLKAVLIHFNYSNIRLRNSQNVSCAMHEGGNPNRISIKLDDYIPAYDWVEGYGGDIISMIMFHRNLKFKDVINQIKLILGVSSDFKNNTNNSDSLFSIFQKLDKRKSNEFEKEEQLFYDEDVLNNFEPIWNEKFLRDNISLSVQKKFQIGFDIFTNRVSIVWRDFEGNIVGVIGRSTKENPENKYLPLLPFKKKLNLYGYSENYMNLVNNHIFIGEAEKFVLQMESYGYSNALALGCSSISDIQIEKILELKPKSIILCFDEGLNPDIIKRNINKIKNKLTLTDINLYLIIDRKNTYIKKGSKNSPTDLGKEIWEHIKKECVIKIR